MAGKAARVFPGIKLNTIVFSVNLVFPFKQVTKLRLLIKGFFFSNNTYFEAIMPAAEAETNCATPVIKKDVEKFPEKTKSSSKEDEAVCKEVMTAEEETKKTEESEKMEKENFPEKESKDESNTMPGNEEKTECECEGPAENAQGESTEMTEHSKRRSTEGDEGSETKEEESPPKKRKST